MKTLTLLFTLICINILGIDDIPLLKWTGPEEKPISRFMNYKAQHPYSEFHTSPVKVNNPQKGTMFAVLIEESLYTEISPSIATYIADLQNEGYSVILHTASSGNPSDLRKYIQQLYSDSGIAGLIMIGDFAVPFFQTDNDFNEGTYDDWACDLFYMDMDGTWEDTLQNSGGTLIPGIDSIYDTHYGDTGPEIFVGRLYGNMPMADSLIFTDYFTRLHNYRISTPSVYHRALFFIDDDWIPWASTWSSDLGLLYDSITQFTDAEATRADTYSIALDSVYEWVSLFAHSWPGGHSFYYNNKNNTNYFWATEYTSKNASAHFYNFFCCSFADYTTSGYGAGRALFADSGLVSIGSSKTGSMLDFYYFYNPLAADSTVGRAFMQWFDHVAEGGFSQTELSWHYGMTLLGDPTLIPDMQVTGIYTIEDTGEDIMTGMMSISDINALPDKEVYDCSGRRIGNVYTPGIYFLKQGLRESRITVFR